MDTLTIPLKAKILCVFTNVIVNVPLETFPNLTIGIPLVPEYPSIDPITIEFAIEEGLSIVNIFDAPASNTDSGKVIIDVIIFSVNIDPTLRIVDDMYIYMYIIT